MRRASRFLLLLGSNQGRRESRLRRAASDLAKIPGARVLARSRVYETDPEGPPQRKYLNAAVCLSAPLSPMGLLIEAKRLEARAGRKPGPRLGPRPLDIDLIACDNARANSPWLRLPHPRAVKRRFVLEPLNEIAPRWRLGGRAISSWRERARRAGGRVEVFLAARIRTKA